MKDAWLTFMAVDDIEIITKLIADHPEFRVMYEEVYEICQNVERVMEMFSKELQKLDRNTAQYMIDEMQDVIDAQKNKLDIQEKKLKQAILISVRIVRNINLPESEILGTLQSEYGLSEQQAKEYLA